MVVVKNEVGSMALTSSRKSRARVRQKWSGNGGENGQFRSAFLDLIIYTIIFTRKKTIQTIVAQWVELVFSRWKENKDL